MIRQWCVEQGDVPISIEQELDAMNNPVRSIATPVRKLLVDIAYPRTCASCGQRGKWLCDVCIADFLPLVPGLCCDRCGHPIIMGRCDCPNMNPAIVKARASSVYDGWVKDAVHAFKYDRERDRVESLAEHMAPALVDLGKVDALVPVPLHPKREDWRGFNQADLLARLLGDTFTLPVESALQRVRETQTQTHSSREERHANMDGAFALNPAWSIDRDAHYVLVDDVYTTGATLGACADVLDAAGAKAISVLTIAFDVQKRELELYREQVKNSLPQ